MDLDIGCVRPMDSLLAFDLLLPQTIPVGVSNDLMFSTKGHPFMDYVIHRLAHFDHDYLLNCTTPSFLILPPPVPADPVILLPHRSHSDVLNRSDGHLSPLVAVPGLTATSQSS